MKILIRRILPTFASFQPCSSLVEYLPNLFYADGFNDFIVYKVICKSWQCPCCEMIVEFAWFLLEVHKNHFLYHIVKFRNSALCFASLQSIKPLFIEVFYCFSDFSYAATHVACYFFDS